MTKWRSGNKNMYRALLDDAEKESLKFIEDEKIELEKMQLKLF